MNKIEFNFENEDTIHTFVDFTLDNGSQSQTYIDTFDNAFEKILIKLDKNLVNLYRTSDNKIDFYKTTMSTIRDSIDDYLMVNLYYIDNKTGSNMKIEINDISINDNKCLIKSIDNNLIVYNY
jgi:hypothetical protein